LKRLTSKVYRYSISLKSRSAHYWTTQFCPSWIWMSHRLSNCKELYLISDTIKANWTKQRTLIIWLARVHCQRKTKNKMNEMKIIYMLFAIIIAQHLYSNEYNNILKYYLSYKFYFIMNSLLKYTDPFK